MENYSSPDIHSSTRRYSPLWDVLFVLALIAGAYFRLTGMNWDANQHLHPDERFLTMVETAVSPVKNLAEYFDTSVSSLNPHNRGYGFYVYGTLPLFLVRYVAESVGQTGYDQVYLVGRYMSAIFDLLVAFLVYLAASRLYRDPRIGALAGSFYALAVLPIQLSHYFAVDTFLGFFGFLTFLFAVLVLTWSPQKQVFHPAKLQPEGMAEEQPEVGEETPLSTEIQSQEPISEYLNRDWRSLIPYILFGVAVGMAAASKVSAGLMAILLPAAGYLYWLKQPKERQEEQFFIILRNLVIAGVVAFVSFRIFQPYAFTGPGFFGLKPNPKWIDNLKELGAQSTGDVDFPPALQWARRPIYFAWINMVQWGFGWPLGLLAWGGFLWMGWRMLKGEWQRHALIWGWTLVYFAWWEINFTRTMRYQMLVYPTLTIIAAWAIIALWDRRSDATKVLARLKWNRVLAIGLGVVVLVGTAAWAFAFTRIYTRPMTRVAASQWIYANVPGPINLHIKTGDGLVSQPIPFRAGFSLETGSNWVMSFRPQSNAALAGLDFAHIVDGQQNPDGKAFQVALTDDPGGQHILTTGVVTDTFLPQDDSRGKEYRLELDTAEQLQAGKTYYLVMNIQPGKQTYVLNFSGPVTLQMVGAEGAFDQALPDPVSALNDRSAGYTVAFTPLQSGTLEEVFLPRIVDWAGLQTDKTLVLGVTNNPSNTNSPEARATVTGQFLADNDPRGAGYTFRLDVPLPVQTGATYYLVLGKTQGPGEIAIYGSRTAIESTWDDPLPLPMEGFSPFDPTNGLYPTNLNFEMYWDDNTDKLNRFTDILDQTDYIFISSNRQWATTVRVPERYPLTTYYYRNLIGCPPEKSIIWCYAEAKPGTFRGNLGFDLVYVSQSDPSLGPIDINDQFAEEAFTVYDHPKVLVFKKNNSYDPARVQTMLSSVDLQNVVHITPRKASSHPGNLMLPPDRLAALQAGGTWSSLFNSRAFYNAEPWLGLVLWYLVITLLGWVVYPFVRLALRGLPDRGYPFTKLIGVLLLAYFSWLSGSAGIPVTRTWITVVAILILVGSAILAFIQRDSLWREWQERKNYFLAIELAALAFFTIDLLIRVGNPDLWHPYKGGEKPMDFSYFNAVLKSTTFPPYDPWFAGGYINYYYFGFVIAGIPVKWLGIVPAISYNLILPTFFSFLAMGAFSFGWNAIAGWRKHSAAEEDGKEPQSFLERNQASLLAGLAAAVALLILGNEGTVRMIWHGLMRLSAPGGNIDVGNIFTKITWSLQGLAQFIGGAKLPYAPGDWYWIPSRVYPGTPITEFPFFTFLYGDPHAHLFALPLTTLALGWAFSIVLGRWQWSDERHRFGWLSFALSFFLGGLVIGSLRPVNTWDLPTYLVLGVVAVVYTVARYGDLFLGGFFELPQASRKILSILFSTAVLVGLSFLLFQPYAKWYATSYNSIELWTGDRSPFWSYMTHWSFFLFLIVSWMVWETRDWMASTPVSSLNKLKPYRLLLEGFVLALVAAVVGLLVEKVTIGWLVLPLAAWAAVLLLRPGQSDAKRVVLFMIGSGLTLTLMVEVVRLAGDIDRMNTVFKFYLQAWTLLSLSAAASLVWLWPVVERIWSERLRTAWYVPMILLLFGAFLYPVMAGADKIRDRMSPTAPHTLNGMTFMAYSTYSDHDVNMQLIQDYYAIRWMQENVKGSPVIVEANQLDLYRWSNRFTIYTGLPDVVGWDWHQRQQRSVVPGEWVTNRVNEIAQFYNTVDPNQALQFLQKYDAKYIIVGQLEQAIYPGPGLAKFAQLNGIYWKQVYQADQTTIYEVIK